MKSKFFGFNAKVALTLLAMSGTMLTGCYETESGDIPLPFVPLPASYTITGQVTNINNGAGIEGATLAATPDLSFDQYGSSFTARTGTAASYAITASKDGFTSGSATVNVKALEAGQAATYFVNIPLTPPVTPPGEIVTEWSVRSIEGQARVVTFNADENTQVDHVNKGTSPKIVSLKIKINQGAAIEKENWIADVPVSMRPEVEGIITAHYNGLPTATFKLVDDFYEFNLAALASVQSVTAKTYYREDIYSFRRGDETAEVSVSVAYRTDYSNLQRAEGHGKGHGHGHGHGDGLNAGGGIASPTN